MNQENQTVNESEIRRQKVDALEAENINPWQSAKAPTATTQEAANSFKEDEPSEAVHALAGRLMTLRDHGKTFFCNLQDRSGTIQLYVKKDLVGDDNFEFIKKYIDLGDIVWASGTIFKTKKGEVTLRVQEMNLMSKCLHPLPEKYHGLADVEQRYRQRYLDLISNPESKAKFIKRSHIVSSIRTFLQDRDFLEVETPMLHPIPGGATARPFITHHNTYDMDLYLRIAPELYLKRLVVGGFDRVFEINRNFRNEGVSTRHNPEFTMLEFYMAHGTYLDGMDLTEELFRTAARDACGALQLPYLDHTLDYEKPFTRMSIEQAVHEVGGFTDAQLADGAIDATLKSQEIEMPKEASMGEKLYALFEKCVEHKLIQPTFITHFPTAVSPLARRNDENPDVTDRFEIFVAGMELGNAFTELTNPIDQAGRFAQQLKAHERGDAEAHHFDKDYVTALEYGMPPAVGVGIGIDRLVMLLTNTTSIKDVILFPTLKKVK